MELFYAILFAIGGTALHILGKFAELERTKRKFNPRKWIKKHLWRTLFGLMGSIGAVVLIDELGQLSVYAAFMAGYMGDSLAKKGQKER